MFQELNIRFDIENKLDGFQLLFSVALICKLASFKSEQFLPKANRNIFIFLTDWVQLALCNVSHIIWLIYYELYRIVTKWQIINDTLALISPIPTTQYFNSAESNTVVKTKRTLFVPFYLIFFHFSGFLSFYRLFDGYILVKWFRKSDKKVIKFSSWKPEVTERKR